MNVKSPASASISHYGQSHRLTTSLITSLFQSASSLPRPSQSHSVIGTIHKHVCGTQYNDRDTVTGSPVQAVQSDPHKFLHNTTRQTMLYYTTLAVIDSCITNELPQHYLIQDPKWIQLATDDFVSYIIMVINLPRHTSRGIYPQASQAPVPPLLTPFAKLKQKFETEKKREKVKSTSLCRFSTSKTTAHPDAYGSSGTAYVVDLDSCFGLGLAPVALVYVRVQRLW